MKKNYRALFQIDPLKKLNIKTDSTISIIKEALNFGIKVYANNPDDLTLVKNNESIRYNTMQTRIKQT